MIGSYSVNWSDAPVKAKILGKATQNVLKAGVYLQGKIRESINRGNPTGRDPSAPGEPPKKVSGQLFDSIAVAGPFTEGNRVYVLVGTNKEYAARLEFGFFGVDARGANVHQEARPYMRPGLQNNQNAVRSIMLTGAL